MKKLILGLLLLGCVFGIQAGDWVLDVLQEQQNQRIDNLVDEINNVENLDKLDFIVASIERKLSMVTNVDIRVAQRTLAMIAQNERIHEEERMEQTAYWTNKLNILLGYKERLLDLRDECRVKFEELNGQQAPMEMELN